MPKHPNPDSKKLAFFRPIDSSDRDGVTCVYRKPAPNASSSRRMRDTMTLLRGSVLRYDDPMTPVSEDDWSALR